MCTVTWRRLAAGGYELLFNRDELRTRAPGLPPRPAERAGVAYLAPRDGAAGGTWLAVSDRGVTVGLLNRQVPGHRPPPEPISRGRLVDRLADAAGPAEVAARLAAADLARFRPFTLLTVDAAGTAGVAAWDGRELTCAGGEPPQPLASSSLDEPGAGYWRRRLLSRYRAAGGGVDGGELLWRFHRSHAPRRGPYSPCMHRPDARTVSFARVRVSAERVALAYAAGPPCRHAPGAELSLPRALPAA